MAPVMAAKAAPVGTACRIVLLADGVWLLAKAWDCGNAKPLPARGVFFGPTSAGFLLFAGTNACAPVRSMHSSAVIGGCRLVMVLYRYRYRIQCVGNEAFRRAGTLMMRGK